MTGTEIFKFFGPFVKVVKAFIKAVKFFGLWWVIILYTPVWLGEIFVGSGNVPRFIKDICWTLTTTLGLCLMILTTIQSILRMLFKNPKFSIYKKIYSLVTGRKQDKGFIAKLDTICGGDVSRNIKEQTHSFMVFGRESKEKYVIKDSSTDGHAVIIGGAGSGKTSCYAIPTIMNWSNPIFAIDIKGELIKKATKSKNQDLIKIFNPNDPMACKYDPFYLLHNSFNRTNEAKAIATALIPLPMDIKDPHWIQSAQNYLTGAILYFEDKRKNFSEAMYEIQFKGAELIEEIINSSCDEAKLFFNTFYAMDSKELGSVLSTMSTHILPFATDPYLQEALSGKGDCIKPNDLENKYSIFINIEEHQLKQWKALLTLIVNQFCNAFERREDGNDNPILFFLDEFARLGKIETMVDGLATLRSKQIHIAIVIQSLAQLDMIYGKVTRQVIMDNCSYKAILNATDTETQEYFSKLVGTYDKQKISSSYNADMTGLGKGTGTSTTTEEKKIIKPEEFAYLENQLIFLSPTGYKRLMKSPYYKDVYFQI